MEILGSGLGALNRLVQQQRQLFSDFALPEGASSVIKAGIVADLVKAYVISHSHLGVLLRSKPNFPSSRAVCNRSHRGMLSLRHFK